MTNEKLLWQPNIFAKKVNRLELLRIKGDNSESQLKLGVIRNHTFETTGSLVQKFLLFSNVSSDIEFSGYDDSLSASLSQVAITIIWLDYARYNMMCSAELVSWLVGKLNFLRSSSRAQLIVANDPDDSERARLINHHLAEWVAVTPGVAILDLVKIKEALGESSFYERRPHLTGSRFSDQAGLEAARELGLRLIPNFVHPRIKAIAVDLDHTLYSGVLGEDGINGVRISDQHVQIQTLLKKLVTQGLLISIVSRNEPDDVRKLFQERTDFVLEESDISSWHVSWGKKSESIKDAAKMFNVSPASFLFIDDNIGEISEVVSEIPDIRVIFAGFSPENTALALEKFPCLWPQTSTPEDSLRAEDVRANQQRKLLSKKDDFAYFKDLSIVLDLSIGSNNDIARLSEISAKTNQFNLSLSRFTQVDVAEYVKDINRRVIHFRMKDKLADSGSIGSLFARRESGILFVDELCISCRAMGRRIEDTLITAAIRRLLEDLPSDVVRFAYTRGDRNQPALRWLEAYSGLGVANDKGLVDLPWATRYVKRHIESVPITVSWRS